MFPVYFLRNRPEKGNGKILAHFCLFFQLNFCFLFREGTSFSSASYTGAATTGRRPCYGIHF